MNEIIAHAFDLEGNAVNVEGAHHEGHLATAREFNLVLTLDEALARIPHFIGGPDEAVCKDIYALLSQNAQESTSPDELLERDKYYYEHFLSTMDIKPRPGFVDVFRMLKLAGYRMTIGSLTPQKQAEVLLERSGLGDLFGTSNIVLKEHVQHPKPAPDVFQKTAEIMGVHPHEQLVWEDSPRGGRAAIAAGSLWIGMPVVIRPATVSALVEAGCSRVFYDWREIDMIALLDNLN